MLVIEKASLSEQDFGIISECLDSNYATINLAFTGDPVKILANNPIMGVILADEKVITKEKIKESNSFKRTLKKEYPTYVCEDGKTIFSHNTPNIGPTISMTSNDNDPLSVVVGFDSRIGASRRIPNGLPDDELLKNIKVLEKIIYSQKCTDQQGRDLKAVIVSLPKRVQYFKSNKSSTE